MKNSSVFRVVVKEFLFLEESEYNFYKLYLNIKILKIKEFWVNSFCNLERGKEISMRMCVFKLDFEIDM